jgi:hypothetical protein
MHLRFCVSERKRSLSIKVKKYITVGQKDGEHNVRYGAEKTGVSEVLEKIWDCAENVK